MNTRKAGNDNLNKQTDDVNAGKRYNGYIKLIVFIVIIGLVILVCALMARNGEFSFVKTIYQGNGIYNAFYSSLDTSDINIPEAETDAETTLPEHVYDMFGEVEYSQIALLLAEDGTIIFDKDGDRSFFPASITKIMTAIVAVENIPDLSVMITMDEDIYTYCAEEYAATSGFVAGESVCALDLLYGTLLTSGADSAIALARHVAGTEEAFAEMMNAKAEEYGLTGTHFANCTGLHNVKHYSTAYDLAIILQNALKNDLLREIMSTYSYCSEATNKHPSGLWLVSTVGKAFRNAGIDMGCILGGKTGFTDEALLCLASFADIDVDGETITFILVTLGAGDGGNDIPYHIYDADLVFNSIDHTPEETEAEDFLDGSSSAEETTEDGAPLPDNDITDPGE